MGNFIKALKTALMIAGATVIGAVVCLLWWGVKAMLICAVVGLSVCALVAASSKNNKP